MAKVTCPVCGMVYDAHEYSTKCPHPSLAANPRVESPFDPVKQPKHYVTHPSGVECITVTEHMNFCRGNAMKYLWRAGEKSNEIQDLEKAVWYIQREIARLKTSRPPSPSSSG